MKTKQEIIQEIQSIPEPLLSEILDFVQFLKQKHITNKSIDLKETNNLETAFLSESSLEKDWLKPEEDEAWQYL